MTLNALLVDPKRYWKPPWRWWDETLLDCCDSLEEVKRRGITLPTLACLARCQGTSTTLRFAADVSLETFRSDVRASCTAAPDELGGVPKERVLIASYNRQRLNQTGTGHFSPIGAYHADADLVLIMDVARFKLPPHWVPLTALFEAMLDIDPDTGKSRGYLSICANAAELSGASNEHCKPHPSEGGAVEEEGSELRMMHECVKQLKEQCCPSCTESEMCPGEPGVV